MRSTSKLLFVLATLCCFQGTLSISIPTYNHKNQLQQNLSAAPQPIVALPGSPKVNFAQYSGYIDVNAATSRSLFYWFTQSSDGHNNTDPVVLWLNGGPGCSSLGGLFEELGPFVPNKDGKTLSLNPYSWNKVANMIFLESPSGVGFSYSADKSDYTVGDVRTANDSYTFLLEFFKQFPQFANNEFFISGESYGGHYVPNLARRILDGNKAKNAPHINLKGFLVGNPWTWAPVDNYGAAFYWWTHALISEATFLGLNKSCNYSDIGPLLAESKCDTYQSKAFEEMGNIDIYDIYYDVCLPSTHPVRNLAKMLGNSNSQLSSFYKLLDERLGYDPCVDSYLGTYLNLPEVKQAIHAKADIKWTGCASINYSYSDLLASELPTYQSIIADGSLRILVYSGDVDAIVPVTGTRAWIKLLNLPEVTSWHPWLSSSKQVGGYATEYKGLTFATVKGAGHLVPGTQPERGLDMFTRFIRNINL